MKLLVKLTILAALIATAFGCATSDKHFDVYLSSTAPIYAINCRSFSRFMISNALQQRKEKGTGVLIRRL